MRSAILWVCGLASLAALLLCWAPPAAAEGSVPLGQERLYTCLDGAGVPRQGTDPISVGNACYASQEPVSGGFIHYKISTCDTSVEPALCQLVSKRDGVEGENFVGYKRIGWQVTSMCPANASPVGSPPTSCTCDSGYSPDGGKCLATCTVNAVSSSGYYDIGTSAGATPRLSGCSKTGCGVYFDGVSPAGSAMVDGVKHWYAKGSYHNSGQRCTAAQQEAKQVGESAAAKPEDSCAAGQAKGTLNGKVVCVDQSGDGTKPTEASEDKAKTTTEKTTTTNPDGSTTTTETTTKTDAEGNKEVTVTRTTTRPDGSSSTETETTNPLPGDGAGQGEEGEKGECELNPAAAGCGGAPSALGDLYTAKDKTFGTVLAAHRDTFMASPIGSAVGGFFVVPSGGTCPTWTGHIPYLDVEVTFDQMCEPWAGTALAMLKAALLVFASFLAFRIAVE